MHKEILNLLDKKIEEKGVTLSPRQYIECFAALYYAASVALIITKKLKKEVIRNEKK